MKTTKLILLLASILLLSACSTKDVEPEYFNIDATEASMPDSKAGSTDILLATNCNPTVTVEESAAGWLSAAITRRCLTLTCTENRQLSLGLPTVQYCADKLCMSANYFGDMIKKTTGNTASNYIRQYIIQRVKNELATGANITQVAYGLGFEYPQHLSRMFKTQTGMTPSEYCQNLRKR